VLDKFIVVDYQEGAGGEFVARFVSSHFGHQLEFDQQHNPDTTQKWLNSNSIVNTDWDAKFEIYLETFLNHCNENNIKQIAVPYHLYKWPRHVEEILKKINHTRFIKINCDKHVDKIYLEFDRKVLSRPIQNFSELQFLLQNKNKDHVDSMLKLYRQKKLTYRNMFPNQEHQLHKLPSNDIEIQYEDFFCNFDLTPHAYQTLCEQLDIAPNANLLSMLLDRNKKNYQSLHEHLSKS
jgi:hypothetical protein